MPQIKVKGLNLDQVKELAKKSAPQLSEICGCPDDWFVFDYLENKFIDCTGTELNQAVVEVCWFARNQEIQDKVATCLDTIIKEIGFEFSQISFKLFYENSYYEDGEHF